MDRNKKIERIADKILAIIENESSLVRNDNERYMYAINQIKKQLEIRVGNLKNFATGFIDNVITADQVQTEGMILGLQEAITEINEWIEDIQEGINDEIESDNISYCR